MLIHAKNLKILNDEKIDTDTQIHVEFKKGHKN